MEYQKSIFDPKTNAERLANIDLSPLTESDKIDLYKHLRREARQTGVEYAWIWGRIFTDLKQKARHGQWQNLLAEAEENPRTVRQWMQLYRLYNSIHEANKHPSIISAISAKSLPKPKEEPKQIEQPERQPISNELATAAAKPVVDPIGTKIELEQAEQERQEAKQAIDITTGQETEWAKDHQPTAAEMLRAQEGRAEEPEPLTARDVQKKPMDREPKRNGRANVRLENGQLIAADDLYGADQVTIEVVDLMKMRGVTVKRTKHGHMRLVKKGEVIW